MQPQVKLKGKDGKPFSLVINEFKGGTNTLLDESRTPKTSVFTSQDVMLDQDGVWRPRYGTMPYGQALVGPIDGWGEAVLYNNDGSTTTYLFALDNGSLKYSQNGGAWTTISGHTWTVGYHAELTQSFGRLYVDNSHDNAAYCDLATMTIISYTALTTPTAPTATLNNLTTGSANAYYKVTAVKNAIGETAASPELHVSINVARDQWVDASHSTSPQSIGLSWSGVTGADSYNIYYSDLSGQEVYLASVSGTSYTDTGKDVPNIYQAAPPFDGTAGPPASVRCLSGNRMWTLGDPAHPARVSWTGTGQNYGSYNPFFGGGYIDLNIGSHEKPVAVRNFRDGKGNQVATVLTSDPNGGGSVWFITLTAQTVDVLSVVIPQAVSQGSIGTNSPYGVVQANNNVFYPSIKGFQTLGSQPTVFNVLVTSEISANIRNMVLSINNQKANLICGVYFLGRILWSLPVDSAVNNQIWVLDLERQAWCAPWNIGVKGFVEYADNNGINHLLAVPVSGNRFIEFSPKFTNDNGVAFTSILEAGLLTATDDHTLWARMDKAFAELGRPRGNVTFSVLGTQKGEPMAQIGSNIFEDSGVTSTADIGNDLVGNFLLGDTGSVPNSFTPSTAKKRILLRKRLNNFKWRITSSDLNQSWSLLEIVMRGVLIPTSDPPDWL